ncbi:MAG: hypothetical protein CVU44_11920 [Chloroflexi bacterium HGW-Chloroflexi-6]|nr:MAG: hypothetical protein CVU44_11920 [Chloroflexi bacterium HGW-Chloroflexi-6]
MRTFHALSLIVFLFLSACSASIEQPETTATLPALAFSTATLPPTFTPQVTLPPAPPTIAPTSAPVDGLTSTQVNVRSGPDASRDSLGLLPAGSQVKIIGRDASGGWLAISFPQSPDGLGWVTAQFVEVSDEIEKLSIIQEAAPEAPAQPASGQPEPQTSPTPAKQERTAKTISQINARSGPASAFESLGLLEANTTVVMTGRNENNTWVQIAYPADSEERAWVAAAYLSYEGFIDSLPAFDNEGKPIQTATVGGIATVLPTTAPGGYQPAVEDLDTAENPAVRLSFSPSGTRRIIYASDVSAPTGDNADWIEFTLVTPQSNQAAFIYFELDCTGNGSITAELRQNGLLVSEFPGLICGQYDVAFKALGGTPYVLQLKADGSATDVRYVTYYFYISTTP